MKFISRIFSLRWFKHKAEDTVSLTDAEQQFQLAKRYDMQRDPVQAFYWYSKAAEQGHTNAQNNLGLLYENGAGVLADEQKAFSLFNQAAELGNAKAQHNLGRMYYLAIGTQQNYQQALFWYRQAEEKENNPATLLNLGSLYYDENFPDRDCIKAIEYWHRAAEQNVSEAQFRLGVEYHIGSNLALDYQQAAYWYHRAVEQDHANAWFNLAVLYYDGLGCEENKQQALSCYLRSAELGYAVAQFNLFLMYQQGDGVDQDSNKAFYWCNKAAERAVPEAQYSLAIFYLRSDPPDNAKEAVEIMHRLAVQGMADAQFALGWLYQEGEFTYQEPQLAIYWYTKAAEQGHRSAQSHLIAAQNMDIRLDCYTPDITINVESLSFGKSFSALVGEKDNEIR